MKLSICSYSFHRLLEQGKLDIFQYIDLCKQLGCTHLQPWNAHFVKPSDLKKVVELGKTPWEGKDSAWLDPPSDKSFLNDIKKYADMKELKFELICVDRAYIYDENKEIMMENRKRAYKWIETAEILEAEGIRIDAGGPQELSDEVFEIIAEGYNDLIEKGGNRGVAIYIENHWGSSNVPENIIRLLKSVKNLKYLFDTNNWAKGRQKDGWEMCARFADATHIKTFEFDESGEEKTVDLSKAITLLKQANYNGVWGIESVPREVDEITGAELTIRLIKKYL